MPRIAAASGPDKNKHVMKIDQPCVSIVFWSPPACWRFQGASSLTPKRLIIHRNSKRCDEKRVARQNRLNACKFLNHFHHSRVGARATYQIQPIHLMPANMAIDDRTDLFHHRADDRKQSLLFTRIFLHFFRFFKARSRRTGDHEREMRTTRWLIGSVY